tara:strand:- start:8145 stop:8654 length:510 start_codon:yes stop_codon:yes gene_type:complete
MTSIFKVGDQTIQLGRAWRDSDGTLQPKNWHIWSEDDKKAAGISEVVLQPFPDGRLYNSSHNADGSVTSTAKPLEDVKTKLKQEVKIRQGTYLFQTDWAIVRKADAGTDIPSNIQTWRDAIRKKATEMEAAIETAADTDAVEALFVKVTTDDDGKVTKSGILYDWPELG